MVVPVKHRYIDSFSYTYQVNKLQEFSDVERMETLSAFYEEKI